MKMKNRILALLMTLCMIFTLVPVGAMAAEGGEALPTVESQTETPVAPPSGGTTGAPPTGDPVGNPPATEPPAGDATGNGDAPAPVGPGDGASSRAANADINGAVSGTVAWENGSVITGAVTISTDTTITVTGTVTVNAGITVTGGTVTFSGTGTLKRGDNFKDVMLTVTGGIVNLTNITLDGAGDSVTAPLVSVAVGATLNLNTGAVLQNNKHTGDTANGGAIVTAGTTTMAGDAKIIGCETTTYGSAVYVQGADNSAKFTMSGGEISGNKILTGGGSGTICIAPDGTGDVEITGGTITNNEVAANGSAIHGGAADSTIVISGGTISGNKRTADAGRYKGCAIFPYLGSLTLSGAPVITGNTDSTGKPTNVLAGNDSSSRTFAIDSTHLSAGAKIGVTGTGAVATNVNYKDLYYLYADSPLDVGLRLDDGTPQTAAAILHLTADSCGPVRIVAGATLATDAVSGNMPSTTYPSLSAALTAVKSDTTGVLEDDGANAPDGVDYTIEFLADCESTGDTISTPSNASSLIIKGNGHTLTMKPGSNGYGYFSVERKTDISDLNIVSEVADKKSDCFHVKAAMTVTNCNFTANAAENGMFHPTGDSLLTLVSGTFTAPGKITSGCSFTMKTGNGSNGVTVPGSGFFNLGKGKKITLSTGSTAPTDPLRIVVADNAASGDVLATATTNAIATAVAGKIVIGDGKSYVVTASGNDIVLKKLQTAVYVANADSSDSCATVGDNTNAGTAAAPYLTLEKAYAEVSGGGTIYLMDDLTYGSAISLGTDKAVTIASCQANGSPWAAATDTHQIIRSAENVSLSLNAGTVTLQNITVTDTPSSNYNNSPICVKGSLILDSGATIQNTTSSFGAIYLFGGTAELKTGSKITGHTNRGTYSDESDTFAGAGGGVTIQGHISPAKLILSGGTITGNTAGIGGGVYFAANALAGSGITLSGGSQVTGNTGGNVYLQSGKTLTLAGLSAGARIGVTAAAEATSTAPVTIATGATKADTAYFVSDDLSNGGISFRKGTIVLDRSTGAKAKIVSLNGSSNIDHYYLTFDEAMTAIATDAGPALDVDGVGNYRLVLLADCTTNGNWPAKKIDLTSDGGNSYTLTAKALVAPSGGTYTATGVNFVDGAKLGEWLHGYSTWTFTNCAVDDFAVAGGGTVALAGTSHVTGDVRIDGATTNQFKLQTGTVAVDGAIKINNGTSVITLLTGSTAAQRYTVTYDQAVPLTADKVIFAAGSSGVAIAAGLAKMVTVSGGSNADQEWVTVASGNDVVLKLAKEYYVSATGDDASIGSFSAPKKTIAGAYAAGVTASEVGLDIRVLSDLPDTEATAFTTAAITSVKISSYSGANVKATTPWTITRAAASGNLLSITAGSVNLTNLMLDGKGIDATASLVNVGAGASLTLKDKTTLRNNKNVTASGRGGGIYTAGAVTMDAGSLVTGNSLTGTGSTYGGGIYVAAGGAFSMNGGAITNNTVTASGGSGGAIMIDPGATNVTARIGGNSVLSGNSCGANGSTIHGGGAGSAILFSGSARVTGNQITAGSHLGGAVFPYGGTLTISDNVQISGNTNPNNQSCNVYLASGKTIAIGGAHMGESSGIGVYCAVVPTVAGATTTIATNAIAADKTHFLSDRSLTEAGIDFDCSTVLLSYDARYIPTPGGGDGGDGGSGSGGSGGGTKPTPPPVVPGKITPVDPHTNGVSKLLQVDKPLAYLNGGKTGLFYPTSGITRGEVAQLFYNLLLDQTAPEAPRAFTDVPAGMWCEQAIQKLTDMGILKGIDGKLFAPNALITRAEFTAIAVRFATGISSGTLHFPDVPAGYWAAGTINTAAQYGWISGFADGNFYPTAAINRAQTAKIVNNMLGRFPDKSQIDGKKDLKTFPDVSADYWAYYEIAEASNAIDHGTAKK